MSSQHIPTPESENNEFSGDMGSVQQQETLRYFSRVAAEWRQKAEGSVQQKVNVIKQRNDYVIEVAKNKDQCSSYLDVGCGTGELVCEITKHGIKAVGVDFAAEMIELCRQKAINENAAGAEFIHASIFDYKPDSLKFDLISANGFLEYISGVQLLNFVYHARSLLAPRGSIVVGSRNRLFNLISLNEYTQMEIVKDALDKLVAEAMIFTSAESPEECFEDLLCFDDPLPSVDRHPLTGIGVNTRHQYTPGQLIRLLNSVGFKVVGLIPVHYHGAPPRFRIEHPSAHVAVAEFMQEFASRCHYLIPFASTFMLHAELV